jgi:hypothetical protein
MTHKNYFLKSRRKKNHKRVMFCDNASASCMMYAKIHKGFAVIVVPAANIKIYTLPNEFGKAIRQGLSHYRRAAYHYKNEMEFEFS